MSHLMVTVGHPDFDETAVVPATALPRMTGQGWFEVDAAQPTPVEVAGQAPDPAEPGPHQTPAIKAAKKPGQRATTTTKEH